MIRIDCNKIIKKQHNFWNHIHFHPTDAIEDDWGRNILDQVAADGVAKTVRMYAMLEDIVSMDEKGNLQYDYTECDARIDYLLSKGFNLLLSYNFIPKCIAIDPDEGTSNAKKKLRYKNKTICASPPKDYAPWDEICYEFTRHIVDRYGEEEVSKWYLQCFNEPDITAFFMKYEPDPMVRVGEYLKLYRGFSKGIRRVSEKLKAGGPAMAHNGVFLVEFLKAVKAENLKMDYFCGHSYGTTPKNLNDGSGRFHVLNNLKKIEFYYRLLKTSGMEDMPIVIDEWGASTHGFFNREECPMLMLREDSRFAAYFGNLITSLAFGSLPVSMLMIHNPMTLAIGDKSEMEKAIDMLEAVKDSIINAYEIKTGLSRAKLAHLMDAETWMDANKALELGFIDGILARENPAHTASAEAISVTPEETTPTENLDDAPKASMMFSRKAVEVALMNKMRHKMIAEAAKIQPKEPKPTGRKVDDLYDRLNLMKY